MKLIAKPVEIPAFYQPYLNHVPSDGKLLMHLNDILDETIQLVHTLSEVQLNFRYANGKWTMKDILVHLSDCERVIIYRTMRIARADKTNLPGFDENLFVEHANAGNRQLADILEELIACRKASILFIESLTEEALNRNGMANSYAIGARLLVNHLYGHHRHHLSIYQERYVVSFPL